MPRRVFGCVGALFAVALIFWTALAAAPAMAEPTHAELACGECHRAGDAVTPVNAEELTARQETLCGACHESALVFSHPTGFAPNRPLAVGFPLDAAGKMSCGTCHDLHASESGSGALRATSNGADICGACHDSGFFEAMADKGRSLHTSGHLNARPQPSTRIDAFSSTCLVCHTKNLSFADAGGGSRNTWLNAGGSINHPIGSVYRQVASRRGYWSPDMLPKEVALPDGKVGCVSCHEGYSRNHGRLVRPDRLCFDCHDK